MRRPCQSRLRQPRCDCTRVLPGILMLALICCLGLEEGRMKCVALVSSCMAVFATVRVVLLPGCWDLNESMPLIWVH